MTDGDREIETAVAVEIRGDHIRGRSIERQVRRREDERSAVHEDGYRVAVPVRDHDVLPAVAIQVGRGAALRKNARDETCLGAESEIVVARIDIEHIWLGADCEIALNTAINEMQQTRQVLGVMRNLWGRGMRRFSVGDT
jgi:hypothetical protein